MCQVKQEQVRFETTTFDLEMMVELHIEIPSIYCNEKKVLEQIKNSVYRWCRGVRINKDALAEAMGMENTRFLDTGNFDLHLIEKNCFARIYGRDGERITNHESE